jgi:hypothetical protein
MATRLGDAPFHVQTLTVAGNSQATAMAVSFLTSPALILAQGNSVSGIRLPAGSKGKVYCVKNLGTQSLQVLLIYPEVGAQINTLGTNNPFSLALQSSAWFFSDGAKTWHTEV